MIITYLTGFFNDKVSKKVNAVNDYYLLDGLFNDEVSKKGNVENDYYLLVELLKVT